MRAARPDFFPPRPLPRPWTSLVVGPAESKSFYVARPVTYVHLPMTACLGRSASVACEVKQRRAKSCPALPRLVPPSSNNKAVDGSFVPPSSPTQGSGAGRGWPQLAQGPACKLQPSLQRRKKVAVTHTYQEVGFSNTGRRPISQQLPCQSYAFAIVLLITNSNIFRRAWNPRSHGPLPADCQAA